MSEDAQLSALPETALPEGGMRMAAETLVTERLRALRRALGRNVGPRDQARSSAQKGPGSVHRRTSSRVEKKCQNKPRLLWKTTSFSVPTGSRLARMSR